MPHSVSGAVGIDAVPRKSVARTELPSVDYIDRFSARFDIHASPEEWARAFFGDAPSPSARALWAGVMRLRLEPPGRCVVAGWSIADRGDDWIRLRAESSALVGNLLVEVDGPITSLTTALHYRTGFGAGEWRVLSPIHRRLVPKLFGRPERRLGVVASPN